MYSDISHDEVKKISDLLIKWIRFNYKEDELEINTNCLNWQSMKLIRCYRVWQLLNKLYPKPFNRVVDIDVLIDDTIYFKNSGIFKPHSEKKILSKKIFSNIISSVITSLNTLKLFFNKKNFIVLKEEIANYLSKKKIYLTGNIIFFNLVVFYRKKKKRSKLKKFLEQENIIYNLDILVAIIPDYLVELLDIYIFLANKIQIKEVHSWVMDIFHCPLLVVNCLIDREILKVGYQHGGGYGFLNRFVFDIEFQFYDRFIFWGFSDKDIYPFRFTNNFKFLEEKRRELFDKKTLNINIYNDSCFSEFYIDDNKLFDICKELRNLDLNTNLILHPYSYATSIALFKNLVDINIFKGDDNFSININSINLVSLYGTLFWKMIIQRKIFIGIYSDITHFSNCYNFRLIELLKINRLIYSEDDLLKEINQISFNEIYNRNTDFYKQLAKLYRNN